MIIQTHPTAFSLNNTQKRRSRHVRHVAYSQNESNKVRHTESMLTLAEVKATVLCYVQGKNSKACQAAYDKVWDLEKAYHRAIDIDFESKDPLATYCIENPDADECKEYDL